MLFMWQNLELKQPKLISNKLLLFSVLALLVLMHLHK